RLRDFQRGSMSSITALLRRWRIRRPIMFILASLKDDDSLTALILKERPGMPGFAKGLVTPSVYQRQSEVEALIGRYGATAVRLWLLVLCDPVWIYSTNPSTLATFLRSLDEDWGAAVRLIRDFLKDDLAFHSDVRTVARRVLTSGWLGRLRRVAEASAMPPVEAFLPGLRLYSCWDGGYVRPFLEQVERFLPRARYRLAPMYAMSTEAIMTLGVFDSDTIRFLPLGYGVLYEFLADGAEETPDQLLAPGALEVGKDYAMVVSDGYGLTRYQTRDVFRCVALHQGLPDLRFLRRQGLAYSFTGEKLTGEHLTEAYERLAGLETALGLRGVHLTCIPSEVGGPHYRLVLAHPGADSVQDTAERLAELSRLFDETLGEINPEFRAKRDSGRLGATRIERMPYDRLAAALDAKTKTEADRERRAWESQFKLLPLYTRLWESLWT
ncbi:MAG: GH3 domain-containing protein, partial [Planctomycetota bacterium]